MTALAITFALLSAATAALSTSVQHHAAETAPASKSGPVSLLLHLVTRPWWLIGQALGIGCLLLHGLALSNGPIALVQPIIISGIVFAVPIRAAISRRLPGPAEFGAVALTAAGLAAFLVASAPSKGSATDQGLQTVLFVGALGLLAALLIASARRIVGATHRAFVLGCVAGVCFGLVAVLLKMTTAAIGEHGLIEALLSWPVWGLVLAGVGGVTTNQFAYRTARLSASMPVLNIVDCLVALGFGYLVFHETPRHSPAALLVEAVGLVASFVGLWLLFLYEEAPDADPLEQLFHPSDPGR